MLHETGQAETKADAEKAFDLFVTTFEAKRGLAWRVRNPRNSGLGCERRLVRARPGR